MTVPGPNGVAAMTLQLSRVTEEPPENKKGRTDEAHPSEFQILAEPVSTMQP